MAIARKQDKFGNMKIAKYWKQLQAEIVRKESETQFTYDDDTYSDHFKDANGFRPRGILWDNFMAKSPAEKQKEWDYLQEKIIEDIAREKRFNHCLQKEVDNFVNYSYRK